MGTLSSLYDLSRNTLLADQKALTATSTNVANQNTVGYTKEIVGWQAEDSVSLSGGPQAPVVTVRSQRDRVLEQRVQQQTQLQSGTAARATVLANVEAVFSLSGDTGTAGSTAVGTALNGFFSSLSALSAAPADTATRQGILTAAGTLASALNQSSAQLVQVAAGINQTLAGAVTAVNGLTAQIAKLNTAIGAMSPSADAGALEDQRQQAIAQLSQYVGLDQISTEGSGITLTTTSGTALVAGTQSFNLSAVNVGGLTQIRDSQGQDVSAGIVGGSIGGQLTAQDTDLPQVQSALDQLAFRVATAVNAANQAGVTSTGLAGGALFAVTATATGAAGAIAVVTSDPNAVAAAATGQGSGGNTNALGLAAVANGTDASGQTIAEALAGLLSGIGSSSAGLQEQNAAQTATLTNLTTARDSESAVSLDTEAANLSQYQQSYNAAARLFQIVDSLNLAAINLGVETAAS